MSESSGGDPMERLARQNPVTSSSIGDADWEAAKERIFRSVVAARPRNRWWKRRTFVAGAILVGALGASAAGYALSRPVSNPTTVGCYKGDSLSSELFVTQFVSSPQATCQSIWKSGKLGPGNPRAFTVCVRSSGVPLVFPTSARLICSTLGLASAEPLTAEEKTIARIYPILDAAVSSTSCPTIGMVEKDAKATLAKLGLRSWRVAVTQGVSQERPCGTDIVEVQQQTIDVESRNRVPSP
jgi:hypothetical protein